MTLRSSLVFEPDTSIEVFFDNIIEVASNHSREVLTWADDELPHIETYARNRNPSSANFTGVLQNDILAKKRKLIYLNSYPTDVIIIDGGQRSAIYGSISPLSIAVRQITYADVAFTSISKGGVAGQYIPIEDCTSTGDSNTDANAVDNAIEDLNAITDAVHYSITQNDYGLPAGAYKLFARIKDTAQVADDVQLTVYNTTDAASIATDTYTATAAFSYVFLDFTIDSADVGDSIKLSIDKATATANTISVDFISFVKV